MIGIFLDIESNGLDGSKHRPIDIAFKFVELNDFKELFAYQSLVSQSKEVWGKSDPKSLAVNGYDFARIQKGKPEAEVKAEILAAFKEKRIKRGNSVFICQNPSFDRHFLSLLISAKEQEDLHWPYHWLDLASMFWAITIKEQALGKASPGAPLLSKDSIARHFALPEEAKPHCAKNGVDHLLLCYSAIFQLSPLLPSGA